MASSSFTPHLGLCNWSESDSPKRADFVSDNSIIDSALGGHIADTDVHMSAAEKSRALTPFESVSYSGNDEGTRTIAFSFRPTFAIVFKKNAPPVSYENGVNVVNSGWAIYGSGGTSGVSIGSGGVVVRQESAASGGKRLSLNESDCQYAIVAFK